MNCSDSFLKTSVALIQNIKKGYMHMVDCVVIYHYVHACTDLEGLALRKMPRAPHTLGKKILDPCITCILSEHAFVAFPTTVPVQEKDRQLQLKTRKTTKPVSGQRCSLEWGRH